MALDLAEHEKKTRKAVKAFWGNREAAQQAQRAAGRADQGQRGGVTAGKNMDGFVALVIDIVKANGLPEACIFRQRRLVTLPGYFRPTKLWDVVVVNQGRLIAAIEFKSHVGSFGNNFNNRSEEAIGTAHDFRTAYREKAFGDHPPPFTGWMILVEDAPGSRRAIGDKSVHFPVLPAFQNASYLKRYDVLCDRLVREQLYTSACVLASPRDAVTTGDYSDLSEITSFKAFVVALAAHVAKEAARFG